MTETKILALIPENLHEELIKEVQELLNQKAQSAQSAQSVHPDIKNFVKKNTPDPLPKKNNN